MTSRILRKLALAAIALAGGLAITTGAHAVPTTTFTSTFTQSNLFSSGTSQNWGDLSVSCSAGTCTVTLNPAGGATFFDTNFVDFTLASGAGTPVLNTAITSDCVGVQCGSLSTNQQVNGFGTFAYSIDLPDGPSDGFSSSQTLFTVSYTGSASTLLADNGSGWDAAGHIAISGNGTTCTGFVGERATGSNATESGTAGAPCNGTSVPEPTTLALLGTGLIGLGMIGFVSRRRRFYS